jgi:hypothetical protein
MTNKIIFPVLIIIFSLLVIFAIVNNRKNKKLNNSIEKFADNFSENKVISGDFLERTKNQIINNAITNSTFTKDILNGTWTTLNTEVNSDYSVTKLMNINVNEIFSMDTQKPNFGTLEIDGEIYNIIILLNENLIAQSQNSKLLNLHMKFLNKFNTDKLDNRPYKNSETFTAVVSMYSNNVLLTKYISYKVFDNKVSPDIYSIIKSKNFLVGQPPPNFDFDTYNVIIGGYKFPSNYMYFSFGLTNADKLKIINSKYQGKLRFSIQRIFESPTKNEIITRNSTPVILDAVDNGSIPSEIVISSFADDKNANSLSKFFKPKSTILYFYKLDRVEKSYDYAKPGLLRSPKDYLQIKSNASSMFDANTDYNDLNSVREKSNNYYKMTYVETKLSNLNDLTIFSFSSIFPFLT